MKNKNKNKKRDFTNSSIPKKIKITLIASIIGLASLVFFTNLAFFNVIAGESNEADITNMAGLFGVLSFILTAIITICILLASFKILHKSVFSPILKFIFAAKKANSELGEIGITMSENTDDEIALMNEVYFDIVNHLKTYIADVTNLSGLAEKFENSANFDSLTGIYNRRRFTELVEKHSVLYASKNEPTFVFMLDLDFFKKVNDTYGHAAGDEVLKVIAGRVKETVRPYDLFGRYGGEEFVMFLSVSDPENALGFAERIRHIVCENPVTFEGKNIPLTISIGVAQAAPFTNYEKAVKFADEALYAAKEGGRNRVEFYKAKPGDYDTDDKKEKSTRTDRSKFK